VLIHLVSELLVTNVTNCVQVSLAVGSLRRPLVISEVDLCHTFVGTGFYTALLVDCSDMLKCSYQFVHTLYEECRLLGCGAVSFLR
jgi:hypothetical protein